MWSEEAFKLLDYPRDILGKGPHTTAPPPQKKNIQNFILKL